MNFSVATRALMVAAALATTAGTSFGTFGQYITGAGATTVANA
jgi:hypothetical protein